LSFPQRGEDLRKEVDVGGRWLYSPVPNSASPPFSVHSFFLVIPSLFSPIIITEKNFAEKSHNTHQTFPTILNLGGRQHHRSLLVGFWGNEEKERDDHMLLFPGGFVVCVEQKRQNQSTSMDLIMFLSADRQTKTQS
jgi:hypothetical protein